ncbi:MAG: hypothetical protein JXJ18_14325, partial [Rhodobacteraceae bacterium]|nr:hypothetical protein [Paracoccaceae bacterium]
MGIIRRLYLLALTAWLSAGCALTPTRGDFAQANPAQAEAIAEDWAKYLVEQYPISTRFALHPEALGEIGRAIERRLRQEGYGIEHVTAENAPPSGTVLTVETVQFDGRAAVSLRIAPATFVSRSYLLAG